jgi:division/cell wall cluster transcriptional repressor MraZ
VGTDMALGAGTLGTAPAAGTLGTAPAAGTLLHGSGEYRIDGKARLILPAAFRGHFQPGKNAVVISRYNFGCLGVWRGDVWQEKLASAYAVMNDGPDEFERAQTLTWNSDPVDLDPQYRVTIPGESRAYAHLEPDSPVRVVGAFDHIELWEPTSWEARNQGHLDKLREEPRPLFPSRRALVGGGAA